MTYRKITFAGIRNQSMITGKKIYVKMDFWGQRMIYFTHRLIVNARFIQKKCTIYRLRNFYIRLIIDFESNHNTMVYLVEQGNIKENQMDLSRYEECKANIAAILRAKKRLQSKRRVSKRETIFMLHGHISQERLRDKYINHA